MVDQRAAPHLLLTLAGRLNLMRLPPLTIVEGHHIDHFGNLIAVIHIDLRHPSARHPIPSIVKGCRPEHAIENGSDVKISTPRTFRNQGENLILDLGEGYFHDSETVQEAVDEPYDTEGTSQQRHTRNRVAQLVGFDWKTQTISTHRTITRTRSFEYGPIGWLFCAAIAPRPRRSAKHGGAPSKMVTPTLHPFTDHASLHALWGAWWQSN